MKKRIGIALVLLLVLSLTLGACGQSGGGGSDAAQELTYVLLNEPDGIDPTITSNSFASPILTNVFEGLVTYDSSGSIVAGQAESWDISEDGLVYTFTLREGLKWSDGSDLTANDFVYSYQRVLTPETTSNYLSMLTDFIANAQEYYDGTATAEELGVQAPDDRTLVLTLKEVAPYFIDVLSMWVYSPVQQAAVEAGGERWTLDPATYVSNGPFKVSELNMGENVVLVKNENYWNAADVKLEKVTLRYILDQSTALTAFLNGEVDGVHGVPGSDIPRLKADENSGLQILSQYGTFYYLFNNEDEVLSDPNVRKALNLAIDRTALIENVTQNGAQPAYSIVSPGYVVDGEDFADGRGTFGMTPSGDIEGAKAALAEAGYPDGEGFPTISFAYYTNDEVKKLVEAIAEMWESNLGITVSITSDDWAVHLENMKAGNYQIATTGWTADYLNPISFLPLLVTGNSNNHSKYSNPDFDALVAQAQSETDAKVAMQLMRDAEALMMEDYPIIPVYFKINTIMMADHVQGWTLTALNNIYFKNTSIK